MLWGASWTCTGVGGVEVVGGQVNAVNTTHCTRLWMRRSALSTFEESLHDFL
jgi:hypothetical protein